MKLIPLTQGKFATVDDADYEWLSQWKWCASRQSDGAFYAIRNSPKKNGKRTEPPVRMHRFAASKTLLLRMRMRPVFIMENLRGPDER